MSDLLHAIAVARLAGGPFSAEHLTGLLHDAVEDDGLTVEDVARLAPAEVAEAVDALTRREHEGYWAYIERLHPNELARKVKIADLTANLERMDAAHDTLRPRYKRALRLLCRPYANRTQPLETVANTENTKSP